MTLRLLTLATSATLLTLAGCATQLPTDAAPTDVPNQRLSGIEARLQAEASASQGLIGALGKKVEALSDELRRMQATAAGQSSSGAAAQQALAARLEKAEQRLQSLANDTRAASSQAASVQLALPAVREKTREAGQQLDRLGAQVSARLMDNSLEQQAESAALAERLEAAEAQLEEMAEQIDEALTQVGAVQAALPALTEKADSVGPRIEKSEQRLGELATQTRNALAQAAGAQTALREKAAEAGPRLDAYGARLAALDKRLDEVARMAQDAFDASGLGQRKIFGKVVESITLTEDKTLFPINSPTLGEQDKAKLDALALRLKALGTAYHLQIHGHTDGFGADDYNYELGKARAEAVKNYLNEKGGIPLLRMSVMSYGSLESTNYAAKSNRRIVVQIMQ